uniref:Uncharacterized protein n=1 Tax=Eutreptiella gymnastica TaxID=73025 RepID=A0A7S1NRX7_9EUGL
MAYRGMLRHSAAYVRYRCLSLSLRAFEACMGVYCRELSVCHAGGPSPSLMMLRVRLTMVWLVQVHGDKTQWHIHHNKKQSLYVIVIIVLGDESTQSTKL